MSEPTRGPGPPEGYAGLPVEMRLEILVGYLADRLAEVRELRDIRLRLNASAAMRSHLEVIGGIQDTIWETLREVRDEVRELRRTLSPAPEE